MTIPPVLVFVQLALTASSTAVHLGVAATLAMLQLVVFAAVVCGYRRARQQYSVGAVVELGFRAQLAEDALARERDRLHELRATVVGITLSNRVLRERRAELNGRTRCRLERMQDAELGRLERLVTDRTPQPLGRVDLTAVVDPLVESVRLRGHRVRWEGTPISAWARQDDVTEIVHVLLENAAQHGGGRDVEIDVEPRGQTLELRIRDHGPGIPPELLGVLFERGVRGPDSSGQGIGLHIARRLAHDMGGRLRVEAPVRGPGAVFALSLPVGVGAVPCLGRSA